MLIEFQTDNGQPILLNWKYVVSIQSDMYLDNGTWRQGEYCYIKMIDNMIWKVVFDFRKWGEIELKFRKVFMEY